MKPLVIVSILAFLLLCGCAKREENLTPADESLIPVYADLLLLSEGYKATVSHLDSTAYQHEVDSILSKAGLTREELSDQIKLLAQSPVLYQQFTEKVRKDLEHRKSRQSS